MLSADGAVGGDEMVAVAVGSFQKSKNGSSLVAVN